MIEGLIPHYGDDRLLEQCVASLDVPYRVWDGNTENHGFAGNCNRLAAQSTADVLIFLNNDCVCLPGWHEPLVAALDHHPIVGAHLIYPDGTTQHAGIAVQRSPFATATNLRHPVVSREVDAVTGACLAVTHDMFDALGGFDEQFWNGYEDVDLCLHATKTTGRRCWFAAESVVVHGESQSGPERWVKARDNERRLNDKWGEP